MASESDAVLLIRAMITAAKADGQIDADERERILGRLVDVGPEERGFLEAEMRESLDLDRWLRELGNPSPALATQIYTASLLAIELDSSAEVKYLKTLTRRLALTEALINRVHDDLGVVRIYA